MCEDFCLLILTYFYSISLLDVDDCDHLEAYPTYSEMQLQNFSLATWDKPWPQEMNWLDPFLNLSSLHGDILEGLFNGYRVTKHVQYHADPDTGCWMYFRYDLELAKKHYFEHYANTNKTMFLCSPDVPMRPDVYFNLTEDDQFLGWCFHILEDGFLEGTWSYIWKTNRLGLSLVVSAAMVIIVTGLAG